MTNSFNWHQEAKLQWDNRATFWNERSTNMWDNGSRKEIVPFVQKYVTTGSNILDIGCGDGYGSYKLHYLGYNVTGVDISSEMISRATKRLKNEDITFLQGDIMNLSFEDNSFDSLMAINVLEWTEVPAKALLEINRVLKKDGLLCVGILGPTAGPRGNSYPRIHGEKTIANTMMPWEFQQLAKEYKLEYLDGFGVYKEEVKKHHLEGLPLELKQALTFMWVFMLRKVD
ncbi:class I SAM-dependent methyltransferase [Virgibacillus byunsanensis]|uniref:Class I SAM-dependent methyltransferase n=1 Tax=Virgibacillus byunsanensis TaxID=570945 RepID=A0ABW3LKY0_9BACI